MCTKTTKVESFFRGMIAHQAWNKQNISTWNIFYQGHDWSWRDVVLALPTKRYVVRYPYQAQTEMWILPGVGKAHGMSDKCGNGEERSDDMIKTEKRTLWGSCSDVPTLQHQAQNIPVLTAITNWWSLAATSAHCKGVLDDILCIDTRSTIDRTFGTIKPSWRDIGMPTQEEW